MGPAFTLAPEKVHVLVRQMVDVSTIYALFYFSVGRAGCRTTGHHEQGMNKYGRQAKDLQAQKVSVPGFALELVVN